MKKVLIPLGFLLVLNLALAACNTSNPGRVVSPGDQVFDLADFAETLFVNGVAVELGSEEVFGFSPFPLGTSISRERTSSSSSSSGRAPLSRWQPPSPKMVELSTAKPSIFLPHHISF